MTGQNLWIIGGHNGSEYTGSQEVLLLNLVTLKFERRKTNGTPPCPRGYHTANYYNGRIVLIAGYDGKQVFDEVFDLSLGVLAYTTHIKHFEVGCELFCLYLLLSKLTGPYSWCGKGVAIWRQIHKLYTLGACDAWRTHTHRKATTTVHVSRQDLTAVFISLRTPSPSFAPFALSGRVVLCQFCLKNAGSVRETTKTIIAHFS